MLDKLNYGNSTLLVTAVRVITNNADQSIQAYNADNGSPIWSVRLTGYDRSLRLIGNSLAVIDYIDTDYHYGLIFIDLLTGERQNVIVPTCTIHDNISTIDPDFGFVYDPQADALFVVFDSPYGCVQRIDLATGEVAWNNAGWWRIVYFCAGWFSISPNGFHPIFSATIKLFEQWIKPPERRKCFHPILITRILPMTITGDRLMTHARRTHGTEKFELWGLDYRLRKISLATGPAER